MPAGWSRHGAVGLGLANPSRTVTEHRGSEHAKLPNPALCLVYNQVTATEPHRTAIYGRRHGLDWRDWRSPPATLVSNGVLPKETTNETAATSRRHLTK